MARYLFADVESHNAGRQYEMEPHEFVRLFQFAWNDGPVELFEVHTPDDIEWVRDQIRKADYVVFHNGISFDLPVIFGTESLEPLHLAQQRKVIDTFYLANLVSPAPYSYTDSNGHTYRDASKPENAMKWLSLENLCFQFELPGKFGSLKEMAKQFQPEGTKVADYDYSLIPLDDPEFLMYSEQDVIAVRALYYRLVQMLRDQGYSGEYVWREMEGLTATCGQMPTNGILVNQEYARARIAEAEKVKTETMAWLVENYDFPTTGKSPWASAKGKEVIVKVLADYGITPETHDWPRTPKGALKLGGQDLIELTKDTDAEEFGQAIAELKGQRSISQLVMDSMKGDGRVHPDVTSLQRSGRWSITRPAVTVFGDRSEKLKADKALFTAEPGKVLVGFDFSNADARAMAAMSGDSAYAKRFEKDAEGNDLHDGHNLNGEAFFGVDAYYGDGPRDKDARPPLRPASKAGGHGMNFNLGAFKLAHMLNDEAKKNGLELHFWAPKHSKSKSPLPPIEQQEDSIDTREMINSFNEGFPWLKAFKDKCVEFADEHGYVESTWGRRMPVDEGRSWTQAPALRGQNVTREMMMDAIIKLCREGDYYAQSLRAVIHDELLVALDEETLEQDIKVVVACMQGVYDPKTPVGMALEFPVSYGYGKTWRDAAH